jgi:alkanesulfonate monooxygenase SsuD/methylene tetrahydromethanopterin reductase-like flavin-dependent oxidoreductase (luciferase family)
MRNVLRLSVLDQSPVRTGMTAAEAVQETLELAQAAEQLGYRRYWLAEHHATPARVPKSSSGRSPRVRAASASARAASC